MSQPTASVAVDALLALIDALQARNRILEQQNAVLTARVAELGKRRPMATFRGLDVVAETAGL